MKVRHLTCSADHAFDVYVERIGEWWPIADHSIHGLEGRGVRFETKVGGRILETGPQGQDSPWGTVTDWEPRRHLAHTWHPGQSPEGATRVEVRFEPKGAGCVMTLTHSGWESPAVGASRANYEQGWDVVLGGYVDVAGT